MPSASSPPPPSVPPPGADSAPGGGGEGTLRLEQSLIEEARRRSREAARAIPNLLEAARGLLAAEGYSVLSALGKGGAGVVFLARDERLERNVAIKAMLPGGGAGGGVDPAEREAFLREARLLARFAHENIVQIFSVIECGDLVFLVMEYVEGESLAALIARRGALPEREALALLIGALRGVESAHRAGLLHRDIKPENILLTRDQRPKVADFGLAAFRPEAASEAGQVVGTPSFMAPEQAAGGVCDPRTDIYSVGLLLYFMLSGQRPRREARSPEETLRLAAEGRLSLDPVREAAPSLSAPARELLERALARDPARRFFDALEFREAAERALLAGGYRAPGARRLRALLRWVALAALPALGLAAGIGAAGWRARTESEELSRRLAPRARGVIADLDALLLTAPEADPARAEWRRLRAALDSALQRRDARALAELLEPAGRELARQEIFRLAELRRPAMPPEAWNSLERQMGTGDPDSLDRLRRTLLYAPGRLSAPLPSATENSTP